ncbi:chorismate mutase [Saccharopolyspora sp. NFXS83]|uniref:chorismate mutase n=1 Tax=Saccharopolyspora sp. NFXS83 TaxID=2993560 RepID=UPI00224AF6BF|nr:chorismate mutase [Saccharopolyspora sp. NFXS83]MCX2729791.1 chorismate mutase [Saccharopolyspora sp. NFXS83]
MKRVEIPIAAVVAAGLLLTGCGAPAAPPADTPVAGADGVADLVRLAEERAVLSDQVAASKFGTGKAVTDPAREAAVIDGARADATRGGVDPEWAAQVFQDQIAASTQVQNDLLRQWSEQPALRPSEKPDLTAIRPELDRIGTAIIAALKTAEPSRATPGCAKTLDQALATESADLDQTHRAALDKALDSICAR